jgi:hypothetical protein
MFRTMSVMLALSICLAGPGAGTADAQAEKPNILIIWGDDIGIFNINPRTGNPHPALVNLRCQGTRHRSTSSGTADDSGTSLVVADLVCARKLTQWRSEQWRSDAMTTMRTRGRP